MLRNNESVSLFVIFDAIPLCRYKRYAPITTYKVFSDITSTIESPSISVFLEVGGDFYIKGFPMA